MAALAKVLFRAFPKSQIDVETLKTIALFCGAGLVVALLLATYGRMPSRHGGLGVRLR